MFLDEKIEGISKREYEVKGLDNYETVSPDDFVLTIKFNSFSYEYRLVRKKENENVVILNDALWDYKFEVRRLIMGDKFIAKKFIRKNIGKYLPRKLINDIVELYFLRKERGRHPLR